MNKEEARIRLDTISSDWVLTVDSPGSLEKGVKLSIEKWDILRNFPTLAGAYGLQHCGLCGWFDNECSDCLLINKEGLSCVEGNSSVREVDLRGLVLDNHKLKSPNTSVSNDLLILLIEAIDAWYERMIRELKEAADNGHISRTWLPNQL